MDVRRVWKNVVARHGAIPYIMAIAMMYVSPIGIVALVEGNKSPNGTVRIANTATSSQLLSYCPVNKSRAAQKIMGAATLAKKTI
jgi:hypothetical protein